MTDDDERDAVWDEYVLGGLLACIGGLRVAIAAVDHERFATEASLALIALLAGVVVLISARFRR